MGTRRGSKMNVALFGWLREMSIKIKIFLGTLLALCAMVALNFTVKDRDYFFIASEAVHLSGIIVLIYKLFTKKTCSDEVLSDFRLKNLWILTLCGKPLEFQMELLPTPATSGTQKGHINLLPMRNSVVAARFISMCKVDIHTLLDMISLLSTFVTIWMIRFKLKSSYIKELDNMRLSFVVVPCVTLAIIIHPNRGHFIIASILWAFCVYLEAISVLPQLRFMQNAKMVEIFTGYYVFALGVSRFLALAHWVIQIYETRGSYLLLLGNGHFWFFAAFFSEMVQSFILADFCYYYMKSFKQGQLLRKMPV